MDSGVIPTPDFRYIPVGFDRIPIGSCSIRSELIVGLMVLGVFAHLLVQIVVVKVLLLVVLLVYYLLQYSKKKQKKIDKHILNIRQ
jgi:chromate transport protein ChrA